VDSPEVSLQREWLVTNGLGGYASTSIGGALTRKYHGLLIAALPSPLGRMVVLSHSEDTVVLPNGEEVLLSTQELVGKDNYSSAPICLREFRLEDGLPYWNYHVNGMTIEKRVMLVHAQNTVHITYRYCFGESSVTFRFRPFFNLRHHEAAVVTGLPYQSRTEGDVCRIDGEGLPSLFLFNSQGARFVSQPKEIQNVFYRIESERGYDCVGTLTSPGLFELALLPGQEITFTASTENWETAVAVKPHDAWMAEQDRREALKARLLNTSPCLEKCLEGQELVFAADQFIILPATRARDNALLTALGENPKTLIAGYHWFTDWGRDSMISLEGLTLTTGRSQDASCILRTFAHYVRDGLIPNMFPDGQEKGLYHTADASLWFIHAVDRYVKLTHDEGLLKDLLPTLQSIISHHIQGTHFGIRVDPEDGLLTQGAEGYALTWMDAKVGDLVVTPRRGKAVEINALWYNALCLMAEWTDSGELFALADKCYHSFNEKFWCSERGYLYDVITQEGKDESCRPNQIFSISLTHPVLDPKYWQKVLETVKSQLLSRVGLRSLAPGYPNYKVVYAGNLFIRDSAYHQGTVWAWLIGPFIDAWLKVYPEKVNEAEGYLEGFKDILSQGCVGTIDEIFDAQEPNLHRGCVAQAWSVAEVLRCLSQVYQKKHPHLSDSAEGKGAADGPLMTEPSGLKREP
jgi:predicted glycogen debranching enzyme